MRQSSSTGTTTHPSAQCAELRHLLPHLEAIRKATKVSSTGAASLSYCTDQNPSQNTCRMQAKFNYDFSSSLYFSLIQHFAFSAHFASHSRKREKHTPLQHAAFSSQSSAAISFQEGRKKITATLCQWQLQAHSPAEINGSFVISFCWRDIWVVPIFPFTCQ